MKNLSCFALLAASVLVACSDEPGAPAAGVVANDALTLCADPNRLPDWFPEAGRLKIFDLPKGRIYTATQSLIYFAQKKGNQPMVLVYERKTDGTMQKSCALNATHYTDTRLSVLNLNSFYLNFASVNRHNADRRMEYTLEKFSVAFVDDLSVIRRVPDLLRQAAMQADDWFPLDIFLALNTLGSLSEGAAKSKTAFYKVAEDVYDFSYEISTTGGTQRFAVKTRYKMK